jgi:hypothetical protein
LGDFLDMDDLNVAARITLEMDKVKIRDLFKKE